jgi:hypothetical protein
MTWVQPLCRPEPVDGDIVRTGADDAAADRRNIVDGRDLDTYRLLITGCLSA